METNAEVPLADGPADGTSVTVELDENGRPPLTHTHLVDSDLADAGIYELESVSGKAPPWLYRYRGKVTSWEDAAP